MEIKLFNTLSRRKEQFIPLVEGKAGMYTCGPTVYDYAHIGNLRTYVFEDILRRVLEYNGLQVRHVMNITDVGHLESDADSGEDKMEKGARRTGKTAWQIAEEYTRAFKGDLHDLNIQEPHVWCKATEHIPEQIAMIECLREKGFTYRTSDGIYFDSAKLPGYGALTGQSAADLRAGARVDMGEKRNPTDFALWKFSPPDSKRQMEWDSPWGKGFPGWHIECSAMAAKYLGRLFDIHCGGEDAIAIHHTNEIAQTQACYGTTLANYWLHGTFLQLGDEKMAKSSGLYLRLETLKEKGFWPLAFRYLCLTGHYRSPLKFTWESLTGAQRALEKLHQQIKDFSHQCGGRVEDRLVPEPRRAFLSAVNDDMNMPQALAAVWETADSQLSPGQKLALMSDFDRVLGLRLANVGLDLHIPPEVEALVEQRRKAREAKNWGESDRLRQEIYEQGFVVEDAPRGQKVRARKFGE
jgi:cysteinyl-tRNA synthetase